jgi:hypothetical protein
MNGYNKRAIGEALNNVVVMTKNPASAKRPLTEGRLRNLVDYTRALIQPAIDHLESEDLCAEEIVYAFSCAALWFQAYRIMKTDKLPMIPATKAFFDKRVEDNIPQLEVKCPNCKKKFNV